MDENEKPRERRVLGVAELRALGHPLRMRIFDILSQHGPQTSSTLAELTGESSGSTSYHLRILAKQDLIREIPERSVGRERWWERPRGQTSWGDTEETRTPAGRAALQAATSEFHRLRNEDTTDFFTRRVDREPEEWRDVSSSFTTTTRMTAAQLGELAERIEALITEAGERHRDQEGDDVRVVSIRADLFPLSPLGGAS
ncbi:ArsR/SmtB family transcription factor [Microbacterium stercoris]|uniref:Helix-turn-helix transcriptional regulator n=1 Tax=Microbacterium stercoris TaxID=2820289 RepID=A0A939QKY4_9MICO|nr:helix-turn-helix domain-containing protein [Microbacterium stercoris]MBO3664085.1 helix-turn-helix transcriptional regulator [Microbacterium stercoris]